MGECVSLDGNAFLIEYWNLALLTSKHFTKISHIVYPESISENTVVGDYLLERKEIGGRGLFFPAGRNLPGG